MGAMLPLLDPPPPATFNASPITALPSPLYHLDMVNTSTTLAAAPTNGEATAEKKQVGDSLDHGDDVLEPGWVWTKLRRNKRVTAEGWFQDVREVHLDLEQASECVQDPRYQLHESELRRTLRYQPGSIASLKPQTTEEEIETFLSLGGLEDSADTPFVIRSLDAGKPSPCPPCLAPKQGDKRVAPLQIKPFPYIYRAGNRPRSDVSCATTLMCVSRRESRSLNGWHGSRRARWRRRGWRSFWWIR